MHPALTRVDHRRWPLPSSPWLWQQVWHDLLFIHWPVDRALLEPLVPRGLPIDTYADQAWLTLAPFHMSGVTLRGVPDLPWLSSFPEMNLRTYVTAENKPGVFFLRMDAGRALAVWAARASLNLPYTWSDMRVSIRDDGSVDYRSEHGNVVFDATYRPVGGPREAKAGSLDAFLAERYCLYTAHLHRVWRVNIHHHPWPLQPAALDVRANTVADSLGLPGPPIDAVLHFSKHIEVIGWAPEAVSQ